MTPNEVEQNKKKTTTTIKRQREHERGTSNKILNGNIKKQTQLNNRAYKPCNMSAM